MSARAVTVVVAIAAMSAVAPLSAQQLYKWVDERGVTNYSNQPPSDPKMVRKARPVDDRLSVYSPDPGLTQAIEDSHKNFEQRQNRRRIEQLEDELAQERRARQDAAAAAAAAQDAQRAYDRCITDGRFDCGDVYGIYPYPAVVVPPRHRRHIPQPHLTPGTTAGNVTADNNFIPGNSAAAGSSTARREGFQRRPSEGRMSRPPSERALPERPLPERR